MQAYLFGGSVHVIHFSVFFSLFLHLQRDPGSVFVLELTIRYTLSLNFNISKIIVKTERNFLKLCSMR